MASMLDRVQGSLDMMILKTLMNGTMHGWGIAHHIRLRSREALEVKQGALYPALHRLERQGWIAATWRASENNRQAKYYRLTAGGRKQLEADANEWHRLVAAVELVLAATGKS